MAIGHGLYKYITIEHILGLYMLAYSTNFPTRTQYIERRIAQELMATSSGKQGSLCALNKTSPEYHLMEQVQQEASLWMLYIAGSTAFLVLIFVNSWGSLSDKYGRYVAFAVPCIGLTAANILNVLVIRFELSLWLMVVASSLQGVSGDLSLFIVGCAGYVSDVTVKGSFERTTRYVLIDTICLSTIGICQFATGYLIKGFGFEAPYLSSFAVTAVCAFLIIFSVPDRRITPPVEDSAGQAPPNTLNVFKNIYNLFRQNKFRGWLLAGYNLIIALLMMVQASLPGILVLYTTGEPFCMDPVEEGDFLTALLASQTVGIIIGGTILTKCLSKFWILHIASALVMVFYITMAFAKDNATLYIGLVGGLFLSVCFPLSRVSMANLTGAHEQGVMFAFSSCLQGIFSFVSPLIFNPIYASTLSFMNGFIFLVFALVTTISWIIILLLHIFEPRWTKYKVLEQENQFQDNDSANKM